MPATAGRVKMPHNNRMSTSHALKTSDIWSKTIGHDPYANQDEGANAADASADAEKAKSLMELARLQNVAGRARGEAGTGGEGTGSGAADEFARRSWLGLKSGKKRRADQSGGGPDGSVGPGAGGGAYGYVDSSSSEEEYVEEAIADGAVATEAKVSDKADSEKQTEHKKKRKKSSSRSKKKRRKRSSSSSGSGSSSDIDDDSSSSSDDSSERRRERRRRRKRKEREREDRKRRKKRSHKHKKSRRSSDS